jgi:hypothetical protein
MKKNSMKQLVAVKTRNEKNYWTRIGVAFENADGSWNLRFDYLPTDPATTIQLREFQTRDDGRGAEDEEPGVAAAPF